MRLTATRLVLLLLALVLAGSWEPAQRALRVDRCLDGGGSYDYTMERCDFERSHPGPSEASAERGGVNWRRVAATMIAVGGLSLVFIWQDRRHASRPVV